MKRSVILAVCLLMLATGAAGAERYGVVVQEAFVRVGPGKKYDWIWKALKYFPISVQKKKGKCLGYFWQVNTPAE